MKLDLKTNRQAIILALLAGADRMPGKDYTGIDNHPGITDLIRAIARAFDLDLDADGRYLRLLVRQGRLTANLILRGVELDASDIAAEIRVIERKKQRVKRMLAKAETTYGTDPRPNLPVVSALPAARPSHDGKGARQT